MPTVAAVNEAVIALVNAAELNNRGQQIIDQVRTISTQAIQEENALPASWNDLWRIVLGPSAGKRSDARAAGRFNAARSSTAPYRGGHSGKRDRASS
jgi:hypothetical protein